MAHFYCIEVARSHIVNVFILIYIVVVVGTGVRTAVAVEVEGSVVLEKRVEMVPSVSIYFAGLPQGTKSFVDAD